MASLDVIIKQMILSAFRSAEMDSASPGHINHFKSMKGDILGSSDEINAAIREAMDGLMEDSGSAEKLEENIIDADIKTGKNKTTNEKQITSISASIYPVPVNPVVGTTSRMLAIVASVTPNLPN